MKTEKAKGRKPIHLTVVIDEDAKTGAVSGHIRLPGIDLTMKLDLKNIDDGFLERLNTVVQAMVMSLNQPKVSEYIPSGVWADFEPCTKRKSKTSAKSKKEKSK